MHYQEFIDNILQTRGRFMECDEYHERHHIIPKCKNGSDDEDNLIDLYAREHFIAHKLLADEYADDGQLVHAYLLMAFVKDGRQQRCELTPEEYEEARKMYAVRFSGRNNPSAKAIIRLSDEKVYDTMKECGIDNHMNITTVTNRAKQRREFMYYNEWLQLSEEEKQRLALIDWSVIEHNNRSEAAKKAGNGGSIACSESTRRKIGAANKGKNGVSIYCYELNESFSSIISASEKYNINKESIRLCVNGKQKHAGKHPVTGQPLTWIKLENKKC